MIAAELAMPRSGQVGRPLSKIPSRLTGDPREVARKVAVPDRALAPRGAALAPLGLHRMLLADQEGRAGSIGDVFQTGLRLRADQLTAGVDLRIGIAHDAL